jgi:predicted AlkP superfamily phosphohydrolase/phosphomutase
VTRAVHTIKHRRGELSSGLVVVVVLALWLCPTEVEAYVGPGAGFAFVTSFFLLLSTGLLTLLALLTWPVRALIRLLRRKRRTRPVRIRRAVIVGLDGLDPSVARTLMEAGKLPNFKQLAERGVFNDLATTCPAISPVAWSSFATGVDPSRHGVFDFLTRDLADYSAILTSTEIRPPQRWVNIGRWRLPLGKPSYRLLQRSVPFWRTLGEHGVRTTVLRVPITFPPERFDGTLLSGMCAPDLLGTQGTYLHLVAGEKGPQGGGVSQDDRGSGQTIHINLGEDGRGEASIPGPPHPWRRDGRELSCPVGVKVEIARKKAVLKIAGKHVEINLGQYCDWVEVPFTVAPGIRLRAICRFLMTSIEPLRIYGTPLNVDPARPVVPLGHPFTFPIFLAKLIGRYTTLGLAEDTTALNDGVIDEAAFLEQCQLFHQEREAMFFEMLKRHRRGTCICVFDITDRIQHMFTGASSDGSIAPAIVELYEQMDEMVGRVQRAVGNDPRDVLLVMSDHGFAPFNHGVNLNTWLHEQGYLSLEPGHDQCGDYLSGVRWAETQAYAIGLSGIYINLGGREPQGVVAEAEAAALRAKIRAGLLELKEPGTGEPVISEVFDTHERYDGPFLDNAPDLLVGYHRGFRASWVTAKGGSGAEAVEPNTRHWTGDHCMDPRLVPGVLFSSLPLRTEGARIEDVAPTLLELFGIEPPVHMTGRSMVPETSTKEVEKA